MSNYEKSKKLFKLYKETLAEFKQVANELDKALMEESDGMLGICLPDIKECHIWTGDRVHGNQAIDCIKALTDDSFKYSMTYDNEDKKYLTTVEGVECFTIIDKDYTYLFEEDNDDHIL